MASAATKKKLVVLGGNGFLGSRICAAAAARNWTVISLSRTGIPNWSSVTASPDAPAWSTKVQWEQADAFRPASYAHHLEHADAVVHTLGILLEADYKGVLTGQLNPLTGLQRAFSAVKQGTQDPLGLPPGAALELQERDRQITYESMNRDTAVALAQEAARAYVPAFVYISAAGGAPILPARYIRTKREAEEIISSKFPQLRPVFVRPGMLYDASRKVTLAAAGMTAMGAAANAVTGGLLGGIMGAGAVKPLKADVVAEAAVEGVEDEGVRGVVETGKIEELANTAWRRGML